MRLDVADIVDVTFEMSLYKAFDGDHVIIHNPSSCEEDFRQSSLFAIYANYFPERSRLAQSSSRPYYVDHQLIVLLTMKTKGSPPKKTVKSGNSLIDKFVL